MKLLPFKWSKSRANEDEDGDRGGGGRLALRRWHRTLGKSHPFTGRRGSSHPWGLRWR